MMKKENMGSIEIFATRADGESYLLRGWRNVTEKMVETIIKPFWFRQVRQPGVSQLVHEPKAGERVLLAVVSRPWPKDALGKLKRGITDERLAMQALPFLRKNPGQVQQKKKHLEATKTYVLAREAGMSHKKASELAKKELHKNPHFPLPAVRVGRQVTAIEYLDEEKAKAENLRNPGTPWRHDYKGNSGAGVFGVNNGAVVIAPQGTKVLNMPDGSAIIKGKARRKLWGYR